MKVIDRIQKCERDLTTAELIDMVAKENRQVDLAFDAKQTDEDGYLSWDAEIGRAWTENGLSAAIRLVGGCFPNTAPTTNTI